LDRAARHFLGPGTVVLADKGLAGRDFAQAVADLEVRLVRPDRKDEPARFGSLGGVRQWIEAIIDTLKDQLSLEGHGAHTIQGCGSGSPSGCWPWPPASGSTGSSTRQSSARWSPSITNTTHQSTSVI
jgi:hypothetical protein